MKKNLTLIICMFYSGASISASFGPHIKEATQHVKQAFQSHEGRALLKGSAAFVTGATADYICTSHQKDCPVAVSANSTAALSLLTSISVCAINEHFLQESCAFLKRVEKMGHKGTCLGLLIALGALSGKMYRIATTSKTK